MKVSSSANGGSLIDDIIVLTVSVAHPQYGSGSHLYLINLDTGKEIHKFSYTPNGFSKVIKTPYSYFIESTGYYFSISLDRQKIWERKLGEHEHKGLTEYSIRSMIDESLIGPIFLDDESFVYISGFGKDSVIINNYVYYRIYSRNFKSINIKKYELNYEFDMLLIGDYYGNENIEYEINNLIVSDNAIRVLYGEYERRTVDPISGAIQYVLLNSYYYDVDKNTGITIAQGKHKTQ